MNVQSKYPTTPDEFLRWNEGREGKREFVNGRVVEMMINVTRNHVRIATNLILALGKHLDRTVYDVGSADFGVRTPDGVRYPDICVDRRTEASTGTDLAATAPVFLAEILSPSSFGRDFVEKLRDYEGVESLRHYAVFSHEEARAWLWTRNTTGSLDGPVEIVGGEALNLSALQIQIMLADIYFGLEFPRN